MRLVQLGAEPSEVGAKVRDALAACGTGDEVLGGVALFGCTPPDDTKPIDAIIVLPRGLIVVVGMDLPEPAQMLDAPLQTPWTVDGWPLVRTEGAVNPGFEALQSASELASSLQNRDLEPLPVATIVAVGPHVGQVTQPSTDLHRGVRVMHPSTTSLLAAARELATYQHRCPLEPARRLLEVLAADAAELTTGELTAEGFPVFAESDPASAETIVLSKIDVPDEPATTPSIRMPSLGAAQRNAILLAHAAKRLAEPLAALSRRTKLIALSAVLTLVCVVVALVAFSGAEKTTAAPPPLPPPVRIDGVEFVRQLSEHDADCARHSLGDVQAWFQRQPCAGLTRQDFSTTVAGRSAAVAVAVVDLPDTASATSLRDELDTAGSGGITDLITDGRRWPGGPSSLDGSAEAVEQDGKQVRVVQTVWTQGGSQPTDVELRSLAERGLRLPAGG
jgi:hypothetical protein